MTQWTPQQLKCLKAIGVPVYAHVTRDRQAAPARDNHEDPAEAQSQSDTPAAPYYYQLGPWVFELEQTLPVESFDWLRDLAAYCKSTPTQVSQAEKPVKLDNYARNKLSPAAKKELWQLLKAAR